ncbi:MAG: hypothetical protein IIB77_05375 [Proteobacteria bacterium]|nr:hypothetical protein [Pseudomonadota bacterium]
MTPRKQHAEDAGYIAERMNPYFPASKVVIYYSEIQGIDVKPDKYAIVCDKHSTLCGMPSIPKARELMKDPAIFCEECRAVSEEI